MSIPSTFIPLIEAAQARDRPPSLNAIDALRSFGQQGVDEYDRSGIGGIESTIVAQGGRRSLADVGRIGSEAGAMSDRAFTSAAGIAERQRRGLGVEMDPTEQASYNRRLGLAKVLGNVDSRNRALQADQSRRNVIRTSSFGLRDIIDQQVYANLEGAANIEGGVQRDAAQSKALRTQQNANTLGQTAGMLLSMFGGK